MLFDYLKMLPSAVCILFGIQLLFKNETRLLSRTMAVILIIYSAIFLYYTFDYNINLSLFYKLDLVYGFIGLIILPLTIVYFSLLTYNYIPRLKLILLFLPACFIALATIIGVLIVGEDKSVLLLQYVYYDRNISLPPDFSLKVVRMLEFELFNLFFILQIMWLMVDGFIMLHKYYGRLSNFYSDIGGKGLEHGYRMLWAFLIFCVLLIFNIFMVPRMDKPGVILSMLYFLYSVCFFITGYSALNIKYSARDFEVVNPLPDKDAIIHASGIESKIPVALDEKIRNVFESDKIFLKKNLTLEDVSDVLRTNRTYVSVVINEVYGKSFSEFVNDYRVAEAKRVMIDSGNSFVIDFIADVSGFSSVSTFYRVFKKGEGVSPIVWYRANHAAKIPEK